jgi:hypothetical protein
MGLDEKRKQKDLEDVTFPDRTRELAEITGSPLTYEVDWSSIADDLEALNFIDNISCHRVNMALRVICADQLGKDAIKTGLTKIRLKNVADPSAKKVGMNGSVLEIQCAYAKGLSGAFSDNEIRQVIEDAL